MIPAPKYPYPFIDHVIITEEEIRNRIQTLGEMITNDYKDLKNWSF